MINQRDIQDSVRDFFKYKSGSIYIGGAVGFALAFGLSFNNEQNNRGYIPLGFSEIGKTRECIERTPSFQVTETCGFMAQKYGRQTRIPSLTEYYASVNDAQMMVFEANNNARTWWKNAEKFAYELEKKIDRSMRIHTQIPEYVERLSRLVANARAVLARLFKAENDIAPTINALRASWDEDHDDKYKMVPRTSMTCDSKGSNCRPVTRYERVYDYTIHTFTYDRSEGRKVVRELDKFYQSNPNIVIGEKLIRPWKTEAENEMAIRDSRKNASDYKDPTEKGYVDLSATWADGSNYSVYAPKAYDAYNRLNQGRPALRAAAKNGYSISYRTESHFDDGPREFQTFERALSTAQAMSSSIGKIRIGIETAEKLMPRILKNAQEYVAAELHNGTAQTSGLRDKIIDDAKEVYVSNFGGGFDVYPARWWLVGLLSIFGGAAGAGLGVLADKRIRQNAGSNSRYNHRHFN